MRWIDYYMKETKKISYFPEFRSPLLSILGGGYKISDIILYNCILPYFTKFSAPPFLKNGIGKNLTPPSKTFIKIIINKI